MRKYAVKDKPTINIISRDNTCRIKVKKPYTTYIIYDKNINKKFRVTVKCMEGDEFDINKGIDIAKLKAEIKQKQYYLKSLINSNDYKCDKQNIETKHVRGLRCLTNILEDAIVENKEDIIKEINNKNGDKNLMNYVKLNSGEIQEFIDFMKTFDTYKNNGKSHDAEINDYHIYLFEDNENVEGVMHINKMETNIK